MTKPITFSDLLLFDNVNRKRSKTFYKLNAINNIIDFKVLENFVTGLYKTNKSTGGRPPIHIAIKVRMLFLQYLYNMSDEQLEDSLLSNFDFQEFVGIGVQDNVPDFTSHWRFKQRLIDTNKLNEFYTIIHKQIIHKGINLKQGQISIIDATIIPSSNRPLSNTEREELKETPSTQKDTEASSTAKNGNKYYGYKGHINVDGQTKMIQSFEFTSAKDHDITQFENLLTGKESEVYADKAYRSKELEKKANLTKVQYNVLRKGYRNMPLSQESIRINKTWSKVRARVEHIFAYMKTKLHYQQARAKTLLRNKLVFMMNVVMYNIFRLDYLLKETAH